MRMLDVYKDVLRELDKYESPDFDPGDFTYWWRTSTDQYVNDNYTKGDVLQKDLDDIRVILSDPDTEFTQDPVNKNKFTLPADYLHILNAEVTTKVLADYRRWKKDAIHRFEMKRERTAKKGLSVRNVYEKAGEDNPKYRIVGGFIYSLIGDKFEPTKIHVWYIKKPTETVLGPIGSDYNDEAFNSTLQFPDYVCREIVKLCKLNILENIESPRLQSSVTMEQLQRK